MLLRSWYAFILKPPVNGRLQAGWWRSARGVFYIPAATLDWHVNPLFHHAAPLTPLDLAVNGQHVSVTSLEHKQETYLWSCQFLFHCQIVCLYRKPYFCHVREPSVLSVNYQTFHSRTNQPELLCSHPKPLRPLVPSKQSNVVHLCIL